MAPLALAFERILECRIYEKLHLESPILDLGCGEGLFAKILLIEKIDTGIDPNSKELARAKELDAYHELIQCFGDSIPKPDCSFNTVFSNSVLEHINEIKPVFKEVYRVLKPGGSFYFTVPSNYFEQYTIMNTILMYLGLSEAAKRFRMYYNRFWKHYHCYSLEMWQLMAEQSGFKVIRAFSYDSRKICLLNDFLTFFSVPAFFMKKLVNRWIIMPPLRRIIFSIIQPLAIALLKGGERDNGGGLVFIAAKKPEAL